MAVLRTWLFPARVASIAALIATLVAGQQDVCGRVCQSDVQCPDRRGVCTYCTEGHCKPPRAACGGPRPAATSNPQLLVIGDSISLGWAPGLFPLLGNAFEGQHNGAAGKQGADGINAGPASKGAECVYHWVGNASVTKPWDLVVFNFGLHSLDSPPTTETETLANYTAEVKAIATLLKQRAHRVIWVTTTPVPLNVTQGPSRHNRDVIRYNAAAAAVMTGAGIPVAHAYSAVMSKCPPTSGPPDSTYTSCYLQSPGGVHFPGHYDPIIDAVYQSIFGKPAPPAPAPATCDQELQRTGCIGAAGAGTGAPCRDCYMAHHTERPSPFATCLLPYEDANVTTPQVRFLDCYCDNTTADCEPKAHLASS